jgi:hypothetical protein
MTIVVNTFCLTILGENIMSIAGEIFDFGYDVRSFVQNAFTYVSFVLYGFDEIDYGAIQRRAYKKPYEEMQTDLTDCTNIDIIMYEAAQQYNTYTARRDIVNAKADMLQISCWGSMLFAVVCLFGFAFGKQESFDSLVFTAGGIAAAGSAVLTLLTACMLLVFYGKDNIVYMSVSRDAMFEGSLDVLRKNKIKAYLGASYANDKALDYLVDVLRVAQFYFSGALVTLIAAYLLLAWFFIF